MSRLSFHGPGKASYKMLNGQGKLCRGQGKSEGESENFFRFFGGKPDRE